MKNLQKLFTHDCQPPTLEDETTYHRWTCTVCGSQWMWKPGRTSTWTATERYGFLGLRTRQVKRSMVLSERGWKLERRPEVWVDA